ncbi:cytochrome P450 [Arenibacter sp. F20364]|uniref:cytochrome P450 n=1 Tax=Arenibacter sp. F20364 TaxID=2926415 RepID=UPI001FF4A373|nr:cytochrome P450 [Arenibacter sp. F20364]MCK0192171.1 cytochrome P450 [Arenibacter sp. F20364]
MNNLKLVSRLQVLKNARRILKNPLPFHHENFEQYGDCFKVQLSTKEIVLFTRSPGLIKHILQKQHKKFIKSPLQTVDLAKYIGHGILTSNGEHWRTHRRMVQPAFHKKKLHNLMGVMREAILMELERIKPGKVQDVFPLMGDLAFQVVAKSLFSSSDIRERMSRLQDITEANQRMLIKEMRQPYLKWWYRLSGEINRHLQLAGEGKKLLLEIIEERRSSSVEIDDLLDMLLRARYEDGSPMPDGQLLDEVLILFTAGHETTANALSFTLFLLAKHPHVQEQVYEEVSMINFEDGNVDLVQGVMQLQLVKQCLEEALRLYPPAYVIDRIATEDDFFEGISLPKGTLVLMSIYELHRYGNFWERPLEFEPSRFGGADKKDFGDYYYPFGAGPRMCVGNNFAMYEMIIAIAEMVKKYKISSTLENLEINPLISLKPKSVPLLFAKR